MRWPTSQDSSAVSQDNKVVDNYNQQKSNIRDTIATGFTGAESFNDFSLKYLEVAHGYIHYIIGGVDQANSYEGTMWPLQFSAFDPLFMVHHW